MTDLSPSVTWQPGTSRDARRLLDSSWLYLFSLAFAVVLNYWGVWRSYFELDDFWMLGWVRFQPTAWDALMTEMRLGYGIRPLMDLQLWLRASLFGLDAAPYYVISIAQHLLVVGLVYWLSLLLHVPRPAAWLGALLFATSYSAYSVVHWITGSNISMGCIPGLLALCLFLLFRRDGKRPFLVLWGLCIGVMLFTNENFATVLPMFVVYDLVVALPGLGFREKAKRLLVHLCYLVWLIPYAVLQMQYILQGTSEYGDLALGPDIVKNYGYLFYLALPYVPGAPVASLISERLSGGWLAIYALVAMALVAIMLLAALYLLWRGTRVQRYLVIWIVLSFFPFALWPFASELSAAPRYRYVPSIAFSILLAWAMVGWWSRRRAAGKGWQWLVPVFVVFVLVSNLFFHQVLNSQRSARGEVKQEVVEWLVRLPTPPEGAEVVLEVPDWYFRDAADICGFVYAAPPECVTLFEGEGPQIEDLATPYWMRISYEGVQVSDDWQ